MPIAPVSFLLESLCFVAFHYINALSVAVVVGLGTVDINGL